MLNRKLIKREISTLHFLFLVTSKLLIGIGIGLVIATHYYFIQPYWYLWVIVGVVLLIPTLNYLMKEESQEELKLKNKL